MNKRCSAILLNKLPLKEKDPGSFTIPCDIGNLRIDNALADLGASISLMPYSMYEKLGLGEPNPTRMSLELADRIPIILGRPFLATARAMIDVFNKRITLRVGDEETKNEQLCSASANEIEEKKPELKDLPSHLEYAYLNGDRACPVIVSSKLTKDEKTSLLQVLEKHKGAIAWKMSDIKGISPSFCAHNILLEENFKPVIQPHRRLNPKVQKVVKNEIMRLLDSGLIYPISDSLWVSPIHVVPKKGGIIVVLNENNEPVPSRTVTGWRMLEHLSENKFYCFLDGFLGFFQIPIAPEDQEKTTFTCPYGTFAYRRMPFRLCNAPATFQRCMTAIFHDMVEDFMEVFMEDFSLMCDASNFAVGAVLGRRKDVKFKPIYYTSKTLNDAQAHYTTTKKELLAVVFSFDKFRPYLILSKTIIYTDHSALKYLFSKQDAKPRLIKWVLLLQGFNIEIKDKKGAKNLAADHLSRLENPNKGILTEMEIADEFLDEHLMVLKTTPDNDEPW
ncbi:reverse transcriptase domain-containing protein [Tanacetum coccineum]